MTGGDEPGEGGVAIHGERVLERLARDERPDQDLDAALGHVDRLRATQEHGRCQRGGRQCGCGSRAWPIAIRLGSTRWLPIDRLSMAGQRGTASRGSEPTLADRPRAGLQRTSRCMP